jgi:pSer/pThr/pTyr-binding forkhead associated (FHA) protein
MDGAKIPLTFRIYKGDQLLRTETLTQPVIKIGKLSSSHLRIDDELVSRMHAVIEVTGPGEISIIDLGSTKGTIVNGQKVNKARLQDGDVIVLGDTRIVLAVGEAAASLDQDAPTAVNTPMLSDPPSANVLASSPRPAAAAPPPAPPTPPSGGFQAPPSRPVPPPAGAPSYAPPPAYAAPTQPSYPAPASYAAPSYGAGAPSGPQSYGAPPQFGLDAGSDVPGMRAIEVAAMLSDSVVAVKHLTDPRSGKVTGMTYGLYFAGIALLVMFAAALFHGYGVAAENHRQYEKWVEVDKKPALDFRPRRMAAGWDALTLFGLIGGLLTITWATARALEEKKSPFFRIGRAKDVEFPTEASPMESFPLVAPQGDDFVFSWAHGMRGEMTAGGKTTPLDQMPTTMQIPLGARIRVEAAPNTFLISSVPAPARQTGAWLASLEGVVLAFFAGSAIAHLAFLALLYSIPPDEKGLALDVLGDNERLAKVQVKPPEDPKQLEDLTQNQKDDGQQSGGTGTKQAGEEGKMGKKDSTRQSGQYAMKKVDGVQPQLAKQQAIDAARNSGILGSFKSQPGGAFASLTGTGDFSSGLDDRDVYGGLIGNEVGEMQGGWGYGISGTGPGGGGTGLGTIGLGRYGTIGHGAGTGTGYGVGSGKGGMRGRSASQPRVNIGNATATGDLDKNIIRRYIRQKLPQIQHCYEKQLVVKPSLQGTVTTQFTISGNGNVTTARAGGMGDGSVESCVADVIKSIQFPKPTGGGIVNVTYPFTFRPAGE